MDEAGLEAVVEAGAAMCPTFTFLANLADHGDAVGAGVGMTDIFRGEIEATGEMMRRAFDAGVPLLCGSESGFALTPYGHWHAREMEVFVDVLGLTPLAGHHLRARPTGRSPCAGRARSASWPRGASPTCWWSTVTPSADVTVLGDRRNLTAVISRGRPVDLDRALARAGPAARRARGRLGRGRC